MGYFEKVDWEAVAYSRKRIQSVYDGNIVNPPVVIGCFSPEIGNDGGLSYVEHRIRKLELETEISSKLPFDYIPAFDLEMGIAAVVETLGAKQLDPDHNKAYFEPLIMEPDDVDKLPLPVLNRSSRLKEAAGRIVEFQKLVGSKVPIRLLDNQSPLSIASILWNYQGFLEAMMTHPGKVHKILEIATEAVIKFTHYQLRLIENAHFPGHCFPPCREGNGIAICDDLAAVLSPAQYREFGIPYNKRIAEEFNGLFIHSCGSVAHQLDNFLLIPHFRGLHCHCNPKEMDPSSVPVTFRNRAVIFADIGCEWSWVETGFSPLQACRAWLLSRLIGDGRGCMIRAPHFSSIEETRAAGFTLRKETRRVMNETMAGLRKSAGAQAGTARRK